MYLICFPLQLKENGLSLYIYRRRKMKRIFVVLLLISALVPVFAMDGQIGVSIAPEWFWINKIEGQDFSDYGQTRFYLTVDGANYFGENGGFGIEYGLGLIFPINTWQGDVTIDANGGTGFAFRAGVGYRHEFNSLLGLVAGLGINGTYDSGSQSYAGQTVSVSEFDLGIYGRVALDITIIDFLRFNAGLAMGGPVYSNMKMSIGNQSESSNVDLSGFYLAPFVGIAYAY